MAPLSKVKNKSMIFLLDNATLPFSLPRWILQQLL